MSNFEPPKPKKFTCKLCSKVFGSRKAIRNHILKDHREKSDKVSYGMSKSKGIRPRKARKSNITELHS